MQGTVTASDPGIYVQGIVPLLTQALGSAPFVHVRHLWGVYRGREQNKQTQGASKAFQWRYVWKKERWKSNKSSKYMDALTGHLTVFAVPKLWWAKLVFSQAQEVQNRITEVIT